MSCCTWKQNKILVQSHPNSINRLWAPFIDFYYLFKSISIIRGDSIRVRNIWASRFSISTQFSFSIKPPTIFQAHSQRSFKGNEVIFRSKIEKLICDFRSTNYIRSSRGQRSEAKRGLVQLSNTQRHNLREKWVYKNPIIFIKIPRFQNFQLNSPSPMSL